MSHDSEHRAFGHTPNEAAAQQDSASSYSCNHCVLIFKTQFYLYEHLHQVHGLGIEAALRDSGLKSLPQSKPKVDKIKPIKSDFAFNCKNCSFKSVNWSIFSEHKKQCSDRSNNESPNASILIKKQKSSTSCKEIKYEKSRKSTSKDVKIYSKSPQTITKYFPAASPLKSDYQAKEEDAKPLRLEESSLKSCGVFQVTATSIDMAQGSKNTSHLLSDLDMMSDPTSAKPVDPFKEAMLNNTSKRTSKESAECNPSKKAKLEIEQPSPTSNCAELSFEVSDDDEEEEEKEEAKYLVSKEVETPNFYFCKHCDFKSENMEHVYSHYEDNHPYVRYSSFYIEEKSDQSATFRCLECPIEFSSDTLLHNHYSNDHPDAPDIFSLKSSDLKLVYKCFVCQFTTSILHSLREHHKEKHPSQTVENPLLYCKYSSTQHGGNFTTQRDSEEHENLEILQPERTITPCPDESSPCSSPKFKPNAQDGTLYNCGKCNFGHKSVVVLHVHYKKCHPEEPITLDKIKQSVGSPCITSSAQKPDMESDLSHSFVKEETCASPLSDPDSVSVDQNLQPVLPTAGLDKPATSLNKLFFCDRCNFSNSNIKSVISHHNAKHGFKRTIEDVLRHTAKMENRNVRSEPNTLPTEYPSAQELYYCQVCNYGNASLKGLVNHQNKVHEVVKDKECILEHTAKIHDQIEKAKSHPTNSILPSGLPLPLIKGKLRLFFCCLCNYRQKDITVITRHFFKVHKGYRVSSQQIVEHSSMVYERLRASSQIKSTEHNHMLVNANKNMKMTKPPSIQTPESQMRLKCYNCSYRTHHVYLLRKHLIHWHKTKMSFSDIVQLCGSGEHFEPGHYCDVCPFRHDDVTVVKAHSTERHCGRSLSHQFMSTQLYLSPDICDPKKRSNSFNYSDTPNGISPQMYPEAYSCKACPFKGTSFSSITSHYQTVHPWSIQKDDSSLNAGKKQSLSNKQQFDTYQEPLDFDNLSGSTEEAKKYCCSYCSATFAGNGGLLIHMGMKHRDQIEEPPQLAKRMQIYKCRSCSYVNNIRSGVLTHTKMKHPNKSLKFDSFYVESKHLNNVNMKVKNGSWKFCGYICKACSLVYPSKELLNEHRKMHKKQPLLNAVSSTGDGSEPMHAEIWCQYCGLYCASAKEYSEHLRVCQKNSNIYPCALCPEAFSSKVQLGIHYTKKHGEKAFFKHYAPLYNQPSNKATAQENKMSNDNVSTVPQSVKLRMFKCPSCRYVNSKHHGTLTHSQMRHPKIVVRAETLKTIEIDVANMIGYLRGSRNYGGFRCKKCPLIYSEMKKLKKHCDRDHNSKARATSQLSATTQPLPAVQNVEPEAASSTQPLSPKIVTKFRHFFKCSVCSYSTSLLKSLGRHYRNRHGKSAYMRFYSPLFNQIKKPTVSVNYEEMRKTENLFFEAKVEETQEKATQQVRVYKCSSCSYGTPYRRYLIAHFRNRHKFDAKAINKQMEKFKNWESTLPIGRFTCKKCPKVFFASKGRLLAHYGTIHSPGLKMDFTIVAERTSRTTGVYRCNSCKKKIFGIKNLCKHLDQHREARMRMKHKKMESKANEVPLEHPPSSLTLAENEIKLEVRSEETVKTPPVSTVSFFDAEVPEEPSEGKHFCLRCKRTFMSLKGLRSHERSHAAFAALGNMTTTDSHEYISQYIVYRSGTTRPYMCTLCSYRTTVLGLGKSHFLKKHQYVSSSVKFDKLSEEEMQQIKEAAPNVMDDFNVDGDEEPGNSFLEAPDVQRQLKHYNVMAQIDPALKPQDIHLSDPRMLPCEMCNFNTQHYSIMRRHYLRRHGKKLIRCKDCNFFTCFKQNLDLHEQMGHSCVQSEPTHLKNLCCPFCLYQSKNKNNMIDHIVLHREERMMPIEVRRSKLSRYLQGVVFRCYKCTFTSGSADSLDSHMAKHNDIKPFKCRLCYFDCAQLRDLEAHLCDKHQVVRNHQLVGQVSLDQLEEREDINSQDDEDDVLQDQQTDVQALKNDQTNQEVSEGSVSPVKDNEGNDHVLEDEVSPDFPNTQNTCGQNCDERLKVHTDDNDVQLGENTSYNKAQTKAQEEVPESLAVRLKEDHSKTQDAQKSRANEEKQKQISAAECMDSPVVDGESDDKNHKSKSNPNIHEAITQHTNDAGKNKLILPSSVERHVSHEVQERKSLGHVISNPNDERSHNQPNSTEETSPYREMPILEKYFLEQRFIFAQHCENSEKSGSRVRDKSFEEGAEMDKTEDEKMQSPPILLATDCVAAVHSPVATVFPCDLCGRSLANTSELQRHMMRHGM